jgi:hypothetical protein
MSELPEDLAACFRGLPVVGQLDQAFLLLTVNERDGVDTCLLSRTELRTYESDGADLMAVVASRRARANLSARPRATIVAVVGDAVHTIECRIVHRTDAPDTAALLLAAAEHRRDTVGVELRPLSFRVEERLRVEERWDRTEQVMRSLAAPAEPS